MLASLMLLATPASARPWQVHTIRTSNPAYSRGVDVLPNGRTAVLVERAIGRARHLELRSGGRTRLLDSAARGFTSADLQHDSGGRLVVIWTRFTGQLFAWTAAAGREQIATAGADPSLTVAPGGRAAIAYAQGGAFVVRGSLRSGFGKSESVGASTATAVPAVGVNASGRIVIAWVQSDGLIALRSAAGRARFGPAQLVPLRERDAGTVVLGQLPKVAITGDGRAIIVVYSVLGRGPTVVDARVEAFDWAARAARPSAAATLSRGAAAGDADVVATGASAVIAWTQRAPGAPRALWATRWTAKGPQRPNVYDTRALGSATLLAPASKGGANVFYRASGERWFTVHLSAAGLYSGTSVVTPSGEQVGTIDVAAAGRRLAASWTAGPPARVEVARPG